PEIPFQFNCKVGNGMYVGLDGDDGDGFVNTAPIKSYKPNENGLYDMRGNVAEWCADVFRPVRDNADVDGLKNQPERDWKMSPENGRDPYIDLLFPDAPQPKDGQL